MAPEWRPSRSGFSRGCSASRNIAISGPRPMLRPIDPPIPLPGADEPFPAAGDGNAAITLWRNPLDPADRRTSAVAPGGTLIDWLLAHYPNGFGRPIRILWNGDELEIEAADRRLAAGDVIGIYVTPGEPASITI